MLKKKEHLNELIENFIDTFCELSKVNKLTGIWDNKRFQECKKPIESANLKFVYQTEKLSRKNVELRSFYRTKIDFIFCKILKLFLE